MQTRYIVFASWMSLLLTHHDQVITLDPSSPWGYEMKHAALHKAGDFDNAVDALETMLSKIAQSPDPVICGELYPRYHDKDDCSHCSQGMATGTSADRAYEIQLAKLFSRLFVICHMYSSTRPPAVSAIKLSRRLHSNPCQSSRNLYHR